MHPCEQDDFRLGKKNSLLFSVAKEGGSETEKHKHENHSQNFTTALIQNGKYAIGLQAVQHSVPTIKCTSQN